jgi:hypothetical protein
VAAIASDFVGKSYYASGAGIAASSDADEAQRVAAKEKTHAAIVIGDRWTDAGVVCAIIGFVSWLVSMRKGRRLPPLVPLSLFILYIAVFLVAV